MYNQNSSCGPVYPDKPEKKITQVQEELDYLEKAVNHTNDLSGQFNCRLSDILTGEPPQVGCDAKINPVNYIPLVARLRELRFKLNHANDSLLSTLNRVEL